MNWLSIVSEVNTDHLTPKEISFFVNKYQNKKNINREEEFEQIVSIINLIYESIQTIDKTSSLFILQEGLSDDAICFINELKLLFKPAYLFASVDSISYIVKDINDKLPTILSKYESTKAFVENPINIADLDDRLFVA